MRLAFFGDVVGKAGRMAVVDHLPRLNGYNLLVINVLGRVFMDALDDPFQAVDREINNAPLGDVADAVIVDIHAEATSEKQGMGVFCDGRASLVVGTHQHVPMADGTLCGIFVETDVSGKAIRAEPIRVGGVLSQARPTL